MDTLCFAVPQKIVIDTGPLFDLLLLNYAEASGHPAAFSKELRYCDEKRKQAILKGFFSQVRCLLTTPGVLAEVHARINHPHHIQKLTRYQIETFWAETERYLRLRGLDERLVRFLDMDPPIVRRLGPIDVSLWELAKREKASILTADDDLYSECTKGVVSVLHVEDLWKG